MNGSEDFSDAASAQQGFDPSDRSSLVAVYSHYDAVMAEVLRLALGEQGIPAYVDNQRQAGLTGVLMVRIYVRGQDANRARQILGEYDATSQ